MAEFTEAVEEMARNQSLGMDGETFGTKLGLMMDTTWEEKQRLVLLMVRVAEGNANKYWLGGFSGGTTLCCSTTPAVVSHYL